MKNSLLRGIYEFYLQGKKAMLLHPGKEIAARLESLGTTQKAFSQQIGKRVSEINELIKGKRNITLARDYLLSQFFQTEQKYWLNKQIDYDYEQFLATLPQEEKKPDPVQEQVVSEQKVQEKISSDPAQSPENEKTKQDSQNSQEQAMLHRFQEVFIAF